MNNSSAMAAAFWDWFAASASRIRAAGPAAIASTDIGAEFTTRLKQFHPNLTWEITAVDSPIWTLCISADGNREVFPAVESLVAAAPPVAGWRVVAFRQRGPLTIRLDFGAFTLSYDDIWYTAQRKGGRLSVTLWIRGLTQENDPALSRAALVLLDNALGEYDAVTRIAELNRGPLPADPEAEPGLHPLRQLPEMVDFLKGA